MDCRRTGLRRVETAFAGMVAIGIFESSQKQRYKEGRGRGGDSDHAAE